MEITPFVIGLILVAVGLMMVAFRRQLFAAEERFYSELPEWLERPYRRYNAVLFPFLVGALILLGGMAMVFSVL